MFGFSASRADTSSASQLLDIEGIGAVLFQRNRRAKRMTITVRPPSRVRVTVPGALPLRIAHDFVIRKRPWIAERLLHFAQRSAPALTNDTHFRTRRHTLRFYPGPHPAVRVALAPDEIRVYHPAQLPPGHEALQQAARAGIEMAYRLEAHEVLPGRVRALAMRYGLSYSQVRIRRTRSRWGSCSSNSTINLSLFLMKLPDELIDYVILHELTHTLHRDHGPNFWGHLHALTGNARGLAARMKQYHPGV